jgi:FtsH-binding integral membrane protein
MAEDILIPLVVFAAIFGIVWVIFSTRNRERMAMIEKGVSPKDFMNQKTSNAFGIIKWGLLLVGVGLGLFLGSILDTYTAIPEEPAYFACALLFGGLGLVAAFIITKRAEKMKKQD